MRLVDLNSWSELLQQDRYTPEKVAEVLWLGLDVVRHATLTGELRAQIVEHHIIRLQGDDVLTWLAVSDRRDSAGRAHTGS